MDILDRDLEPVEGARLGDLHVGHEPGGEILENDPVGGGEEGEDVFDEVALSVVEIVLPVACVLGEVDFFGGPEGGFGFLVHLPDLRVVDWEHAESVWGWG